MPFEDFILHEPSFVDPKLCEGIIRYFENCEEAGLLLERGAAERVCTLQSSALNVQLKLECDRAYAAYSDRYDIITRFYKHAVGDVRVRRLGPAQSSIAAPYEDDSITDTAKVLGVAIFLNDVEGEGDTEFVYVGKRFSARRGSLLIWPAAFTYARRHQPPVSAPMYLATTWYCAAS